MIRLLLLRVQYTSPTTSDPSYDCAVAVLSNQKADSSDVLCYD